MIRSSTFRKRYVDVFVCFTTKALHLELCSDLTTAVFLAAFTRFVGTQSAIKNGFLKYFKVSPEKSFKNMHLKYKLAVHTSKCTPHGRILRISSKKLSAPLKENGRYS